MRPRLRRKAAIVPLEHAVDVSSAWRYRHRRAGRAARDTARVLGTCTATERKLLYDHYVAGRSFADIARERGVTRAAIKMRHDAVIGRARKFFGLDIVHGAAISHP